MPETESAELLPCANCAATATRMRDDKRWWVECDNCGMSTPTDNFGNPDKVWNTRSTRTPEQAEAEARDIATKLVREPFDPDPIRPDGPDEYEERWRIKLIERITSALLAGPDEYKRGVEAAKNIVMTKWATVTVGKVKPEFQAEYEREHVIAAIRALLSEPKEQV